MAFCRALELDWYRTRPDRGLDDPFFPYDFRGAVVVGIREYSRMKLHRFPNSGFSEYPMVLPGSTSFYAGEVSSLTIYEFFIGRATRTVVIGMELLSMTTLVLRRHTYLQEATVTRFGR